MKQIKIALQAGVTLIELLFSLVVIAVIIFLAAHYFVLARGNTSVTQALSRIDTLDNASFQWVQGQRGDFCGSLQNTACDNPITSQALLDAGLITKNDLINPWNSQVSASFTINPTAVTPDTRKGSAVAIGLPDVPKQACESLKQKLKNRSSQVSCDNGFEVDFSLNNSNQ